MGWIEVDDHLDEQLQELGRRWEVSKGEALARVLIEWEGQGPGPATRRDVVTEPVVGAQGGIHIYFEYRDVRNTALFDPETGHLEITAGPALGRVFTSPSSAASTIVSMVNPAIVGSRNGWITWKLVDTDELLDTLRRGSR